MIAARQSYDYIVVGAGSAGCTLAARLSADEDRTVLLLEAGPRDPLPAMAVPDAWLTLLDTPANWGDISANGFTGDLIPTPRGRGLGGSSSINGLNYLRGHRAGYDAWADSGAPGWGYDDLLPYFRRSETAIGRDPAVRGTDGPMVVSPPPHPNPVATAMVDAAVEAGHARTVDLSSGQETGFGCADFNIVAGARQSAADAYLTPVLDRPNLEIVTDAMVRRALISEGRCVGVEVGSDGRTATVWCGGEVILAAGAIGTAQLLMLSGIGPAQHLRDVGITPLLDLPGVGANLHDHPFATVTYRARRAVPVIHANPIGEAMGFVRSDAAVDAPDLQFVMCAHPIPVPTLPQPEHGYSIAFSIMSPHSRGSVRLASADADTLPVVDPNYLDDHRDVAAMLDAMREARRIGRGHALREWRDAEIHPGADVDDADALHRYLQLSLRCYFHYVGTARIGAHAMAVVDTDLRVHGISNLRVADASVMPSIIGANTNATVHAIAERAADLIMTKTAAAANR
jgi:choline dehydrogenase